MRYLLVFCCLLFVVSSCTDASNASVVSGGAGVYYWRTDWAFSAADQAVAGQLGLRQLYVRLFDLDWDDARGAVRPKGGINFPDSLTAYPENLDPTPVVYIVNRVFRETDAVEELAARVGHAIEKLTVGYPLLASASRWQIDCDWTPGTRDRYFRFLEELQRQFPAKTISVTVRLHQYRERKDNGVPPVPEGLLMCYNLSPVEDVDVRNAIFDLELLKGYLKAEPYPLPLDVALPVFSWGAAFRDGQFLGIISPPSQLGDLLEATSRDRWLVRRDTTVRNTFLRAGDAIRYDGPGSSAALQEAVGLLRKQENLRDLLFFDWQPTELEAWDVAGLIKDYYHK